MKKFFKDYWNLQKMGCQFLKEHWLGYLFFVVVLAMGETFLVCAHYGIWCFDWMETIWNKITGVFTKA